MTIDLIGFGNTDNAVTSRPARTITRGAVDTWARDCSSPDANDGTAWPADIFNDVLAQLRVAMRTAGIALDNGDDMLWRAMQSVGIRYAVDSGAADAIVVTNTPPVASLYAGLTLLIKIAVDGAGATVINADGLGNKALKWPDGTDIAAGDTKAGGIILTTYDGVKWQLLCRINGGSAAAANFVPGCIYQWPMDTPPTGALECDGSAVSRSTYARLFGIIGTNYGPGNGTTTFNLPDYRGETMRGRDHGRGADLGVATRTNRGDGTTGDHVGTKQGEAVGAFSGQLNFTWAPNAPVTTGSRAASPITFLNDAGYDTGIYPVTGASVSYTPAAGSETRSRNVSILHVIAF